MAISEQEEYKDADGKKQPAIRWLLDVMSHDRIAQDHQVFRITNDQVLNFLELKRKPGFYRYSFDEMFPDESRKRKFHNEFERVKNMAPKKRQQFHEKILELAQRLKMYEELNNLKIPGIEPVAGQEAWNSLAQADNEIIKPFEPMLRQQAEQHVLATLQKGGIDVNPNDPRQLELLMALVEQEFQKRRRQLADAERPAFNVTAEEFHNILRSYKVADVERFNQLVREFYQAHHTKLESPLALAAISPLVLTFHEAHSSNLDSSITNKVDFEWYFNQFSPFKVAALLYVMVLMLACLGWLVWPDALQTSAFYLAIVAFAVHSFGLGGRMYLQGRPPVTNLYASAVFIGWGGVLLCLGMERIYRNGIGNVLAAIAGGSTMLIALDLAESLALGEQSDTLQTLVAVLDTNFWLATHVTSVTLGYMATFVAAIIGVIYIFGGIFTTALDAARTRPSVR